MKACAKETFTSAVRQRKSLAARGPGAQSHFNNAAFSLIAWRAPLRYYENNSHLD
ncbi:hypothetical protein O0880_23520 [Janthinobacterium sp. SUN118]|uniref:hypothetical protein n=1 Tax=Janthinobacterium sp. SUN118 TaxID=3004100 RepID=UPI0025B152C1|nr:hypothetical protein [Janthinobacterium sp. SUN118]MDN2712398.1 hypothetical protein [Janthinobacterium sp. SUN118]